MLEIGWSVLQQLLTWNVGLHKGQRIGERTSACVPGCSKLLLLLLSLPLSFSALHLCIPRFRYYQTPSFVLFSSLHSFIHSFIHSFFYINNITFAHSIFVKFFANSLPYHLITFSQLASVLLSSIDSQNSVSNRATPEYLQSVCCLPIVAFQRLAPQTTSCPVTAAPDTSPLQRLSFQLTFGTRPFNHLIC